MKIVINNCFGGFGLSTKAMLRLRELGSEKAKNYAVLPGEKYSDGSERTYFNDGLDGNYPDIDRTDPLLIKVVKELGDEVNSAFSKLKIVNIPDGIEWEIDNYDGLETVHEKHRSWS